MVNETEIKAPLEKVYGDFLDMDNFASSFSGDIQVKKNYQGDPKVGDTFDLSGEISGGRIKSTPKFVELVPNSRIVLEQVSGDFKSFRNTIVLEKTEDGTCVTETWEYKPPYSILGKILDAVRIRKDMKNSLTESHSKAKERLENQRSSK